MPTKFVVLWLQTIFIEKDPPDFGTGNTIADNETVLQADHFSTLEEAWQFYNKKVSDPINQQVMILVPLKDFNRTTK